MNKKEGIPKWASRMVRSLETVGKKCTSSGANKPKGKNDTYLQILKSYVSKDNGINLFPRFRKWNLNQCVENKGNGIQFNKRTHNNKKHLITEGVKMDK